MRKQYVVIGLGNFGMSVAKTLAAYDAIEVIAIDKEMKRVEAIADVVTQANVLDVTDKKALEAVGVSDCDKAIVAIGNHLESAILAILHLKELGVKEIVAKSNNVINTSILKKIGADVVVEPEREMGVEIARALLSDQVHEVNLIDDKHCIMEINVPKAWIGQTIAQLNLRQKYEATILGIRKTKLEFLNTDFLDDTVLECDDLLTLFATESFFQFMLKQ